MALDIFGNLFGGNTTTGINALLSADQRRLMNQQGNLSAAAALLQAGGRSRQRVGLGQALGAALQAGQQGYQQARTGSLQELLLGEKLQESKDERQRNLDYLKLLEGTPAPATVAPTAMPPMPAPQQGVQVFPLDGSPTSEANQPSLAGLLQQQAIDQAAAPATAPAAAPASANLTGGLNRDMRALLARTPRKEGMQFLLNQAQAAQEFGAPTAVTINGKPVMVQYNKQGQRRVVADAMPYEAQSPDIRAVEYISGQPLAGTGPAGITQVGKYRQQIAPKTQVDVKMPGNQQFLAGVGTDISATLGNLTAGANAANSTLRNVERILPALDKAVLGPGADYRTTLLRVGQQLGIAGQNANDTLAQTATVVQGLAQAELDAAAQMKGQGTLTEAERAILRRAAGGDQSLTAVEIQTGLNAAKKNAQARLQLQEDYLRRARKLPGFEQFAPLYEVTPYGGNNPLINLIDQSLQQRQGGR